MFDEEFKVLEKGSTFIHINYTPRYLKSFVSNNRTCCRIIFHNVDFVPIHRTLNKEMTKFIIRLCCSIY